MRLFFLVTVRFKRFRRLNKSYEGAVYGLVVLLFSFIIAPGVFLRGRGEGSCVVISSVGEHLEGHKKPFFGGSGEQLSIDVCRGCISDEVIEKQ